MTSSVAVIDIREPLTIEPLTGVVGAEIAGVELGRPLTDAGFKAIREALDEHLVLFFRGQSMGPAELRTLVAAFGPVFRHPTAKGAFNDFPEVLELRREPGGQLFGGENWHADVSWQAPVGYVTVLHGVEVPRVGNDTSFANTIVAFEALSSTMQGLLRTMRAEHVFHVLVPGESDFRRSVHPVVRRHPRTGREGIYLNRFFVKTFEGMTVDESRPLLDFLFAHLVRHEFTCRFRWQPGSVAMWDNRFTLHLPINDTTTERRLMVRATALESI